MTTDNPWVDVLLASGGYITIGGSVVAVLRNKSFWDFMTHVVDVLNERSLVKDPKKARRAAKLRHGNFGKK